MIRPGAKFFCPFWAHFTATSYPPGRCPGLFSHCPLRGRRPADWLSTLPRRGNRGGCPLFASQPSLGERLRVGELGSGMGLGVDFPWGGVRCGCQGVLLLLVNANVIYLICCRQEALVGAVGSAPIASPRKVQLNIELLLSAKTFFLV